MSKLNQDRSRGQELPHGDRSLWTCPGHRLVPPRRQRVGQRFGGLHRHGNERVFVCVFDLVTQTNISEANQINLQCVHLSRLSTHTSPHLFTVMSAMFCCCHSCTVANSTVWFYMWGFSLAVGAPRPADDFNSGIILINNRDGLRNE